MTNQKKQQSDQAGEPTQDTPAQYPGRYLMTAKEAEIFLGCSHHQLYKLMWQGLPHIRVDCWLRFSPDGLKAWIAAQEAKQVEEHTPHETWMNRTQQSPPAPKLKSQQRRPGGR